MRLFISIVVFFLFFASCSEENTTNYEVGGDFINSDVVIRVVDTFSIKAGTFKQENITTSSTGRILLGSLKDNTLGDITAQPYFQLTSSSTNFVSSTGVHVITDDAKYDSIAFVLNTDAYYEGDTTKIQTYKLHEILTEVEPTDDDNTVFFNTDVLDYNRNEILGEITFAPRPQKTSDSLYIAMSDTFGNRIFNAIKNEEIESSNDFINEFEGLTIVPEKNNSNIIGFNIETTETITENAYMRLYYTEEDIDDQQYIDFFISPTVLVDKPRQFNSIYLDPINIDPELQTILTDSETTISSETTQNLTYIQSGSGISTRIDMQSIRKLREISEFGTALNATLTFKPDKRSFQSISDLEQSLNIFIINDKNEIISQLINANNEVITANLNSDNNEFDTNTFYSVDLTEYVNTILNSETVLDSALMIQFTNSNSEIKRTVIDTSDNDDLKLSIKYLTF